MTPSEAEYALVFVAKRQGGATLPASQWAHVLSLELGWLSPADARGFVTGAKDAGLLVEDGDALRLDTDWKTIEVPRRFRLSDPVVEAPEPHAVAGDPFVDLLKDLAGALDSDRKGAMAKVAAWQERFGGELEAEAAALLAAAEAGLDVRERAQAALERLKDSAPATG